MIKNKCTMTHLLALSALMAMSLTHAAPAQRTSVKHIQQGPIQGLVQDEMQQYKGIPYAQPPLADLRWQPPLPAKSWSDTRSADAFAPTCATRISLGGFSATSESEDCLYLNVYTPQTSKANDKRPVMVVIPGGGLMTGSGNDYDPSYFIDQDLIVVSLNYRVGVFGFFSHPALNSEGHPAINYGIMDQQAALRWVKDNIAQFGGDPNNVTLYGESAGGQSVLTHLAAPASAGLFHQGIVSSGAYSLTQRTVAAHNLAGEQLAKNLGCEDTNPGKVAACLRSQSTTTLLDQNLALTPSLGLNSDTPTIDGTILPASFKTAFSSGQYNQVPVINGFNADEGSFFVGMMALEMDQPINVASFAQKLPMYLSATKTRQVLDVLKTRPSSGNVGQDFADVFGRARFICTMPTTNALLAQHVPVYGYEFADEQSSTMIPDTTFRYGAAHINDLQYVFKDFRGDSGLLRPLTTPQKQLSHAMVTYFSNFAKTGSPNSAGLPQWQAYSAKTDAFMRLHPSPEGFGMVAAMTERYGCAPYQTMD